VTDDPGPASASLGFISIAGTTQRAIGGFILDPAIHLPVELVPGDPSATTKELAWEAIVSGTLKLLAREPGHEHADYYRRFVLAVRPDIRAEFTGAGILTARNGNYELAIEIFRALEGLFPGDAVTALNLALAHEGRARTLERTGREDPADEAREAAFEAYKRALAADPGEPAVHFNLAFFHLHQRGFEKAREHLTAFLRLSDDREKRAEARRIVKEIDAQGLTDGQFQRAYDCIRMGREEEGVEAARGLLERHPTAWHAWFLLGWGCRRLGRWAQGREAFEKAVSLGGSGPDPLNELAICQMELGDLASAERTLRSALALEPENTKIVSNLGIVALRGGKADEARGYFRTVLELDPEDAVARSTLASLEKK
jgi:Flp pilus assembly protein TadD